MLTLYVVGKGLDKNSSLHLQCGSMPFSSSVLESLNLNTQKAGLRIAHDSLVMHANNLYKHDSDSNSDWPDLAVCVLFSCCGNQTYVSYPNKCLRSRISILIIGFSILLTSMRARQD